jgi:hypothetical protein
VVLALGVEWGVQVDQVYGLVFDELPERLEIVAAVEAADEVGHGKNSKNRKMLATGESGRTRGCFRSEESPQAGVI